MRTAHATQPAPDATQPVPPDDSIVASAVRVRRVLAPWSHTAPLPDGFGIEDIRVFAWDSDEISIRGIGHVKGFDAHTADEIERLSKAIGGDPAPGWPAFVGGRSFDREPGGAEWVGWPGALYWLPSHLLVRTATRTVSIRHVLESASAADSPEVDWSRCARALPRALREAEWPTGAWHDVETHAEFVQWVERAREAMRRGDIRKAVLARRVRMSLSAVAAAAEEFSPLVRHTFDNLGTAAHQVRYGVHLPECGTLIGATPETLLRLDGHRLWTEALAGTSPAAEAAALVDRAKDRDEHEWVVEALGAALAPRSKSVRIEGPSARVFGRIAHIRTAIEAELHAPGRLLDWIDRLHPSPAVCGWPRAQAAAFLSQVEPYSRGWYAGALAWTDGVGRGHAVVSLRCGLFRDSDAYLYAGAGIVPASEPECEWNETEWKLRRMATAVQPTRLYGSSRP